MEKTITEISPWKATGPDTIPTGFLEMCGTPLFEVLAVLFQGCVRGGFYPHQFKRARTVVLPKADRPRRDIVDAWRPVALLNTIGKVLEKIIVKKLAEAIERGGVLPDEQMGNRRERSTEIAVQKQ